MTVLLALALSMTVQVQAAAVADRSTYEQLIDCAATFRIAGAVAQRDGDEDLTRSAVMAGATYDVVAWRYGRPLDIADADTDASIRTRFQAQADRYGRLLAGNPALARQSMTGDQQVCAALSARLVRETSEAAAAD